MKLKKKYWKIVDRMYWIFLDKIIVKIFYRYRFSETFEYFELMSRDNPRWWVQYSWWKPLSTQSANPIYMARFPNEKFWQHNND